MLGRCSGRRQARSGTLSQLQAGPHVHVDDDRGDLCDFALREVKPQFFVQGRNLLVTERGETFAVGERGSLPGRVHGALTPRRQVCGLFGPDPDPGRHLGVENQAVRAGVELCDAQTEEL